MKIECEWFKTASKADVEAWLAGSELPVTGSELRMFRSRGAIVIFNLKDSEIVDEVARFNTIEGIRASHIPNSGWLEHVTGVSVPQPAAHAEQAA
jgi:hypothetical protein